MRITSPAVSVKDIWDALVADYGVAGSYGLLVETYLDGKVSLAKADLSTLETRLSAARAGFLANLDNAELLNIPDLTNLTPTRQAYLDNIDSSLLELFYEHFGSTVDDFAGATIGGTVTDPEKLVDNNVGLAPTWDTINEYVEFTFDSSVYIKEFRVHGHGSNNEDGRASIQAFIAGVWTDVKTAIPSRPSGWSAWGDLTTPSVAAMWRFKLTTVDTGTAASYQELELKGVKVG